MRAQAQARADAQRLAAQIESDKRANARWESLQTTVTVAMGYLSIVGTFAAGLVVVGGSAGLTIALVRSGLAWGDAVSMRAKLLHRNQSTGALPALVCLRNGTYQIIDPSNGLVQIADMRQPADRVLIASLKQMQIAATVSRNQPRTPELPMIISGLVKNGK
jgi:hypothetical protein